MACFLDTSVEADYKSQGDELLRNPCHNVVSLILLSPYSTLVPWQVGQVVPQKSSSSKFEVKLCDNISILCSLLNFCLVVLNVPEHWHRKNQMSTQVVNPCHNVVTLPIKEAQSPQCAILQSNSCLVVCLLVGPHVVWPSAQCVGPEMYIAAICVMRLWLKDERMVR